MRWPWRRRPKDVPFDDFWRVSSLQEGDGVRHWLQNISAVPLFRLEVKDHFIERLDPGESFDWYEGPDEFVYISGPQGQLQGYDTIIVTFDIPRSAT